MENLARSTGRSLASLALALMFVSPATAGRIDLDAVRHFAFGSGAVDTCTGDFDNDGLSDIAAVPEYVTGFLGVLLGRADGTFAIGSYAAPSFCTSVRSADFDGDGILDLAISANGLIALMRGNGSGSFVWSTSVPSPGFNEGVFAGDFNGDGDVDAAIANRSSDDVRVFLGDGAMGLSPGATFSAGNDPQGLSGGDFDHDGAADLLVGSFDDLALFMGLGDGTFVRGADLGPIAARAVLASDVNADGDLDVLYGGQGLGVALGDGLGGLSAPAVHATIKAVGPLATGDLDRDGKLDVVGSGLRISGFRGRGDGTFAAPRYVSASTATSSVVAADFDGDGFVDVAAGTGGTGAVDVLPNWNGRRLPKPVYLKTVDRPMGLAASDFDEDGNPDALVSRESLVSLPESFRLYLFRGNGRGKFEAPQTFFSPDPLTSMLVADFDGDGHADVAGASTQTSVRILLGDGSGAFSGSNVLIGAYPRGIASGDFDGNGYADVATAGGDAGAKVLLGDGSGSFTVTTVGTGSGGATCLTVADIDEDGDVDILAGQPDTDTGVLLLAGDGAGGFGAPVRIATTIRPTQLVVADLDSDGHPDIAAIHRTPFSVHNVCVVRSDGAGGFSTRSCSTANAESRYLLCADYDADGNLDLTALLDSGFAVLQGLGAGLFAPPIPFGVGLRCDKGAHADFDLDSRPDLIIYDENQTYVMVNRSR